MDSSQKKELQSNYKSRDMIGGVFLIRNTVNNRILLDAATDLGSRKNRFEFSQKTGSCVELKLKKDWSEQEGSNFVFEVLEELEKGETQTLKDFSADIGFLKEIWLEKLSSEDFY